MGSAVPNLNRQRNLGSSPVHVPPLGLGTAPLGNLYRAVTEQDARAVVAAALDAGCHYLDTAPHYGLGLAEERLGRELAGRDRAAYRLSTKVGRRLRPLAPGEAVDGQGFVDTPPRAREWDLSRDGILATLEASLDRLGVDAVDIVYLHDVEGRERQVHETAFPALARLRADGTVGAIGFGMNHSGPLARFVADLDVDVVLCAGRWTLLDQGALADLLPVCLQRGTSVVVGGVYNSGLLADPRPGAPYDYRQAPPHLVARARALREVCARHGVPLRAAALRFPFGHPAVAAAVVGAASAAEVRDNAALFGWPVPDALWYELVDRGLLDEGVPLPTEG
ncbi:aldo/keto reductase [Streptantibioticus rubrisoli]|uniref:Aldo/keto reductase n=1 Tax=Streptantibioticus rubrisoli TaxID=1387313 RepID=A0ABT1PMB1_9ACTN|nr:aldo/keto reductase [Streptantibioticus rubrisoli]MCQ4046484.1 aldo/keto reductase [Streptantibioticus rubrisoli]